MMIMKVMLLLSVLTHASSFRANKVEDLELSSADSTKGSTSSVGKVEMMPADATELSRTTAFSGAMSYNRDTELARKARAFQEADAPFYIGGAFASTRVGWCCLCAGADTPLLGGDDTAIIISWYASRRQDCGTKEGCPSDTFAFSPEVALAYNSDAECTNEATMVIDKLGLGPFSRAGQALQAGVVNRK